MTSTYSFEKLIAPHSAEDFFQNYWEKKPLIVRRNEASYYQELLSLSSFDHAITTSLLHHPTCFIANAAQEVSSEAYTYPSGLIDAARLYQQFVAGGTIVMNQLENIWPPLAQFCRALERAVCTRFQCNIYMTPKNAQGFPSHYDSHDVFVLQVQGTKHWILYDTPIELPFRNQGFVRDQFPRGEITQEFDLHPGDMLYLPRGVMHDAQSREGETLHITLGALATSWTELLLEAVAKVSLNDVEFRRSLPVGYARSNFDRTQAKKIFDSLLERVVERADFDNALDYFANDLVDSRHAIVEGQLGQIMKVDGIDVETKMGVRPNLLYRHRVEGEQVVVSAYGGEIRLPSHAEEPLLFALENASFAVKDLPGRLDADGKLVLVKRLVREGLIRILD